MGVVNMINVFSDVWEFRVGHH